MPRKRADKAKPIGRSRTTADTEDSLHDIELELRLAKAYWLETVQPYVVGRRLQGAELHVATDAHWRVREAMQKAKEWNSSQEGKRSPVTKDQFLDVKGQEFCEPRELVADESLKPETLAMIAAPLLCNSAMKLSPSEAVRVAHDLLIAAEVHLVALPKQPAMNVFVNAFEQRVPFTEITLSTEKASGKLPLLPATLGRNEGKLSLEALRKAIRDYFGKLIQDTERKLNDLRDAPKRLENLRIKNQQLRDDLDSALRMQSIQLIHLCCMRWERFERSRMEQRTRALNRKPPEEGNDKLPKGTAMSPVAAGKRSQ
jgi:hypothetical protein